MPETQLMTIGALNGDPYYEYPDPGVAGYPGYGGPDTTYNYGSVEPPWLINRVPMPPNTPQIPQNLPRVTNKTLSDSMSSTGESVYALYGLSGVGMLGKQGGQAGPYDNMTRDDLIAEVNTYKIYAAGMGIGYRILGAATAGVQAANRKMGVGGIVLLGLAGAVFPLLTNGVTYFWPKR